MKTINEIIAEYETAKAARKAVEKREKELAEMIKAAAGNTGIVNTENYSVIIDVRTREGLNTKELYHDFPDIKKEYGTVTEYAVITVKKKKTVAA